MAAVRRAKSDGAHIPGQPVLSCDHRERRLSPQPSGFSRKLVVATPHLRGGFVRHTVYNVCVVTRRCSDGLVRG